MKFLDIFAGIGGFRLGLERAGHECVGHVEIDKFANQSYAAIHKPKESEVFFEDITRITDEDIRGLRDLGIDIIAGGFPCQAFSIAGKRAGFEDTRGTLFFDIARIAREIKPEYLFLENVKGLLNHAKGDTFEVILRTLDELGYDAEWEVLNSKDFGVPQNRERVFIIGHLRGSGGRKVFPITGQGGQTDQAVIEPRLIGGIGEINFGKQYRQGNRVYDADAIAMCLTAQPVGNTGGNSYLYAVKETVAEINQIGNLIDTDSFGGNPQVGRVYGIDGISPCLNTMGGGGREPKVAIPVPTPDRLEKRQNGRRFKENGDPMFTLTAQDRHGVVLSGKTDERMTRQAIETYNSNQCDDGDMIQPYNRQVIKDGIAPTLTTRPEGFKTAILPIQNLRIRKLTPRECWRLQGFPDWAFDRAREAGVSDSQLYKQAGNSVTVNVIEAIGRKLAMEDHS